MSVPISIPAWAMKAAVKLYPRRNLAWQERIAGIIARECPAGKLAEALRPLMEDEPGTCPGCDAARAALVAWEKEQ